MGGGGQDMPKGGREQARLLSSVDRWKNFVEMVVARWSCTTIAGCVTKERGTNRLFTNIPYVFLGGWLDSSTALSQI